jgi:hypothetical protein
MRFAAFRKEFTAVDHNYLSALIIENHTLTTGIRSQEILTLNEVNTGIWDEQTKLFLQKVALSDLI